MKYYLKIAAVSAVAALLLLGAVAAAFHIRLTAQSTTDAEKAYSNPQREFAVAVDEDEPESSDPALPQMDWPAIKIAYPDVATPATRVSTLPHRRTHRFWLRTAEV